MTWLNAGGSVQIKAVVGGRIGIFLGGRPAVWMSRFLTIQTLNKRCDNATGQLTICLQSYGSVSFGFGLNNR